MKRTDSMPGVLSHFHPLIGRWFTERIGQPTDIQQQAWPLIAAARHVLITAPTGSGKTLTAFLWAINQLVTGEWETGCAKILYVSPLKALNNDIHRNLISPLGELKQVFEEAGEPFPEIRVRTRSGDTPESERRRMQRHPPEILITTPESLNLLLSSPGGRLILRNLSTVILDEIHAVIGNKRGVHLITAVDRLVALSGEFQRIALSATIKPLETVAAFMGGLAAEGNPPDVRYTPRPVSVVQSAATKQYDIQVRFPEEAVNRQIHDSVWEPLAVELKRVIAANRSTLLFTNSRRLCEKLTLKINHGEEWPVAYAHHGSLSREIREEVERKLKLGELQAIVATNSLELGIDIGALDEVVLIQSPPSVSSAIQRIGRAGHQVGQVSRGCLYPTHSTDFLEAAVLAPAILNQNIETIKTVEYPLDVLAQVIVSMVGVETWNIDELYVQLRASYPYRNLSRQQFDLVLNMLAGRYADMRIRELKPRVYIDRLDNTVAARKGALLALYTSGGTIPDRGYFHLRHSETNAMIGELDEEFVWEASIGQTFTLGTQNWKIERITHNDVLVIPANPRVMETPFWKGEENGRDFHFSEQIGQFMERANDCLDDPEFALNLQRDHRMDSTAAEQLLEFLKKQREQTRCDLPHRHHLLIEFVSSGPGATPGNQVVLHTLWGGKVNRPFAMALDAAWEKRFGHRLEVYTGNDCIVLLLPEEVRADELLSLVTSANAESLLRERLEGSGFFGARFRESAGRSLLLTRNKMSERMPLWMSRLRSQKLLDAVLRYDDFPILLEAWRTCLQDEFDLPGLRQILAELESGEIKWSEARTSHPSPIAQSLTWGQINRYMYMGDEPASQKTSRLRSDLLRDVVFSPGIRPAVSREIIEQFELKRQRLSPGYSPTTARELIEWVKERLILPSSELEALLQIMQRDHGVNPAVMLKAAAVKLMRLSAPTAAESLIVALELLPRVVSSLYGKASSVTVESLFSFTLTTGANETFTREHEEGEESIRQILLPAEERPGGADFLDEYLSTLLGEWLQFYGPVSLDFIQTTLGIDKNRLFQTLEDLIDSQKLISGQLVTDGSDNDVCDAENFEILLRLARREAIPSFQPLGIEWLPLFLGSYQGLTGSEEGIDGLYHVLEQLQCYNTPANLWESEILPARLKPFDPSWLDTVMQESDLRWIGSENRRVAFCFESDLDLMQQEENGQGAIDLETDDSDESGGGTPGQDHDRFLELFSDEAGRYDFNTLLRKSNLKPEELTDRIWEAVWQGRVTNSNFLALRRGIEHRFKLPDLSALKANQRSRRRRSGSRAGFSKWKDSVYFSGNWFRLPVLELNSGLLEFEERKKERVRVLLDRYGILFRELLERESPQFRWSSLFRSLRLMELSGEVLAGCFFHGIPGLQFISHQAFRLLQRKLPEEAIYWINAADPASLCGIPLEALKSQLPKRVESAHLVFHGHRLVLVSQRNGKSLNFHVPPDDPNLQSYLGVLRHLLTRRFEALRRITIEAINDEEAARSPYVDALRTGFEVMTEYKQVILYRLLH